MGRHGSPHPIKLIDSIWSTYITGLYLSTKILQQQNVWQKTQQGTEVKSTVGEIKRDRELLARIPKLIGYINAAGCRGQEDAEVDDAELALKLVIFSS